MSCYKAKFTVGWLSVDAKGNSLQELIDVIEKEQDLMCLIQQVNMMGTKKDKREVQKLIAFLDKRNADKLTVEDVKELDVKLSVGRIKCDEFIENE